MMANGNLQDFVNQYIVYFSNDGTKPMIVKYVGLCHKDDFYNGQKTLSLKVGYHARIMIIG